MRIADRFALHGAQPEPLRGVVGRLLQAAVVEHQRFGLAVFEEQLAVVGAFEAAFEQRLGAALVEAGAGIRLSVESGMGASWIGDVTHIYSCLAKCRCRGEEISEAIMDASLDAAGLVARLRGTFETGRTREIAWRREQLEALRRLLREGEGRLIAAIAADFSKPAFETDYRNPQRGLGNRPRVAAPCALDARASREHPWCCGPVPAASSGAARRRAHHRTLELSGAASALPLVGALAAGNRAVLKPSELMPHTSEALAALVLQYMDRDAIALVPGGADASQRCSRTLRSHLLHWRCAGRALVMEAAAKHLTPVTLELGGKSRAWSRPTRT